MIRGEYPCFYGVHTILSLFFQAGERRYPECKMIELEIMEG